MIGKTINITVIFIIGVCAVSCDIARSSDNACLRVPMARDVKRTGDIITLIRKRTIDGRLKNLDVIREKAPEEVTEDDIRYLIEIEDYFGLETDHREREMPYYAGALSILCQAELDSLESQDRDFSRTGTAIFEAVDIANIRHEIAHILDTQNTAYYWVKLLDYREVQLLKPKTLYFLVNRLIVFIKESERASRFAEGRSVQFSAIVTVLEELKKTLTAYEYNRMVDINENLRTMFSMYAIDLKLDPQSLYCMGNPVKLFYIWMNLRRNSEEAFIEAIGKKGVIRKQLDIIIRTRKIHKQGKDFVEIVFSDNGPGIPEEMLKDRRLFVRGETTKKNGTGMGLYIVEDIVKGYGGVIEARNIPGGTGAEFTILLPSANISEIAILKTRHSTDL